MNHTSGRRDDKSGDSENRNNRNRDDENLDNNNRAETFRQYSNADIPNCQFAGVPENKNPFLHGQTAQQMREQTKFRQYKAIDEWNRRHRQQ